MLTGFTGLLFQLARPGSSSLESWYDLCMWLPSAPPTLEAVSLEEWPLNGESENQFAFRACHCPAGLPGQSHLTSLEPTFPHMSREGVGLAHPRFRPAGPPTVMPPASPSGLKTTVDPDLDHLKSQLVFCPGDFCLSHSSGLEGDYSNLWHICYTFKSCLCATALCCSLRDGIPLLSFSFLSWGHLPPD